MSLDDERWREFVKTFAPKSDEEMAHVYRAELRDRFAMAALTGFLANPSLERMPEDVWASDAYIFADAMLKARGDE